MRIRDEKGLESEGMKDIDAEKENTFLLLNKMKERNGSRIAQETGEKKPIYMNIDCSDDVKVNNCNINLR